MADGPDNVTAGGTLAGAATGAGLLFDDVALGAAAGFLFDDAVLGAVAGLLSDDAATGADNFGPLGTEAAFGAAGFGLLLAAGAGFAGTGDFSELANVSSMSVPMTRCPWRLRRAATDEAPLSNSRIAASDTVTSRPPSSDEVAHFIGIT